MEVSAASNCGDDADRLAGRNGGVETLQIANVVVGHEYVDELAQGAIVAEQAIAEAGMR